MNSHTKLKFVYQFCGLALILVAWSFASPVGSAADELSHLQRTYCFTGDKVCPPGSNFVDMPAQLVNGVSNCWRMPRFQVVFNCNSETSTKRSTSIERPFVGSYSSTFYKTMAYFYSENLPLSVGLMRTFNALLMVFVATFSHQLLRKIYKYSINSLVLLLPNVSFFVASVNPTSWSIIALYGLTCSLISIYSTKANRANCTLAAFSLALSFSGRPDTKYWSFLLLISACSIFIIAQKSHSFRLLRYFVITILIGLPIATVIKYNSLKKFSLSSFSDGSTYDSLHLVLYNLRKTPLFLSHIISSGSGSYGSAYLSKPFMIILNCFILYLLVKGIQRSSTLVRAMIVYAFGLVVFLINYFHFIWGFTIFSPIHPRYFLPILVVCFILLGLESNHSLTMRSLNLISICASLLTLFSLHTTLRRWSVGLFEFQKTGTYTFTANHKSFEVWLYEESWREHFNDLVFLNSKWSPIFMGGQWMVLTLAIGGSFLLILSLQEIKPTFQDDFR